MRGAKLIECGVLIVRYFGGTKLGTGGLVRAYGGGAKDVVSIAELIIYAKKELISFHTTYSLAPRFEHFLKKENLHVDSKSYETSLIVWKIYLSKIELKLFCDFASLYERSGFKIH